MDGTGAVTGGEDGVSFAGGAGGAGRSGDRRTSWKPTAQTLENLCNEVSKSGSEDEDAGEGEGESERTLGLPTQHNRLGTQVNCGFNPTSLTN